MPILYRRYLSDANLALQYETSLLFSPLINFNLISLCTIPDRLLSLPNSLAQERFFRAPNERKQPGARLPITFFEA